MANYNTSNVGVLLNSTCPVVQPMTSAAGTTYQVQTGGLGAGQIAAASNGAYNGMGRLRVGGTDFTPPLATSNLINGGSTAVTPSATMAGLYVSRKVTVPASGSQDFARTVDSFQNPTTKAITTTVTILGNLGSDAATTVFATSDGTGVVSTNDQWIGTDNGSGGPAVITYIHGPLGTCAHEREPRRRQYYMELQPHRARRPNGRVGLLHDRRRNACGRDRRCQCPGHPYGLRRPCGRLPVEHRPGRAGQFCLLYSHSRDFYDEFHGGMLRRECLCHCFPHGRGQPFANETLSFLLNGVTVGTAITNAAGTASLPNISLSGLAAGTYSGGLSVRFAGDATHWQSSAAANLTVTAVPEVSAMLVENGLTERSYVDQLTFQFNKPMISTASVPMTLTYLGTQENVDEPVAVTAGQFQWSTVPGTGASVLTWSLESFAGGTASLPDGYYQLRLPSGLITDTYGFPLDGNGDGQPGGDYVANFFVLQGDVNGDGVVDGNDMAAVDAVMGSRPGSSNWNPNADLTRSGTVTTSDQIIVYDNMGHTISPSVPQTVAGQPASLVL